MYNGNMNSRQQQILAAIIKEYTETALPVSSHVLVEKFHIDASPATVRNDMMYLEKAGYLHQPHVSAGRVPTDEGYRFFVEEIMKDRELSRKEQQRLQEEVLKLKAKNQAMGRTTAKLLSALSGNFAISGIVEKDEFYDFGMKELLEQPEFRSLDEMCKLAEALDYIDEKVEVLLKKLKKGETKIFIGKENPISEISNCAMVVSSYEMKDGERGILALIGPKRMEYAKNKSLIEYVKKLLGGMAVIVISNIMN